MDKLIEMRFNDPDKVEDDSLPKGCITRYLVYIIVSLLEFIWGSLLIDLDIYKNTLKLDL